MFRKILIANRGEIALRIIRTCKRLGVKTVAVYSNADLESKHVISADEAYEIGGGPPSESYLNIPKIMKAAKKSRAEAIHPGYGFLSENPELARACEENDLVFIGPSSRVLDRVANKLESKKFVQEAGVPVVPGATTEVQTTDKAESEARRIGLPVLVKAVYGGGGRGMRIHLGERECSLQRRYQKILEETPSPALDPKKHNRLLSLALKVVQATHYENAGTVEFVLSKEGKSYYLETNKRIQVEHHISEMVTSVDIVEKQLIMASEHRLDLSLEEITFTGAALNCRINAEDPSRGFAPDPGRVTKFVPPGGPGIRIDCALYDGAPVPEYYDSLIAKVAAYTLDRDGAVERMRVALNETVIEGVRT